MRTKSRGSIELVYIFAILIFLTISSTSIHSFYRNMVVAKQHVTNKNFDKLVKENISVEIMEYIKENKVDNINYSIDGYNVEIKKITDIGSDKVSKTKFVKDYSKSTIFNFTKSMNIAQKGNKYFIFSTSSKPFKVTNSLNNNSYDIGYIDGKYHCGIEDSENKTINISSNDGNLDNEVFVYEFNKNIIDYNFIVAKLEKNQKESYILYMTYNNQIKEIFTIDK